MSRITISLFLLLACLMVPIETSNAADTKVSKEVQSISQSNNQFAFDLYQQLRSEEGNVFFSPTSISTALSMTYAGAEGQTEKEIATVLKIKLPEDQVHSSFASLMATLNSPKNSSANWCNRRFRTTRRSAPAIRARSSRAAR